MGSGCGSGVAPVCSEAPPPLQVQLKEFVKVGDSIYEVDPTEESGFRFSRLLPFKVSAMIDRLLE